MIAERDYVTGVRWPRNLSQYGGLSTYWLAAEWLKDCETVADWGGATGHLGGLLPHVRYHVVDGTRQCADQVLADLTTYHGRSDGIALRHVLDNTLQWWPILRNAIAAFRQRMVVVTFTPDVVLTTRIDHANGWPVWHFNPNDLRGEMGDLLVREETVSTTHPERVYYLERR